MNVTSSTKTSEYVLCHVPSLGTPTRTRSRHARVCLRASIPRPGVVVATRATDESRGRSPGVALDASRVVALGVAVDVRRFRRRATGWLRV